MVRVKRFRKLNFIESFEHIFEHCISADSLLFYRWYSKMFSQVVSKSPRGHTYTVTAVFACRRPVQNATGECRNACIKRNGLSVVGRSCSNSAGPGFNFAFSFQVCRRFNNLILNSPSLWVHTSFSAVWPSPENFHIFQRFVYKFYILACCPLTSGRQTTSSPLRVNFVFCPFSSTQYPTYPE